MAKSEESVARIQRWLNDCGATLAVDGVAGPATWLAFGRCVLREPATRNAISALLGVLAQDAKSTETLVAQLRTVGVSNA